MPALDPATSRMQSSRSTIWANPPWYKKRAKRIATIAWIYIVFAIFWHSKAYNTNAPPCSKIYI